MDRYSLLHCRTDHVGSLLRPPELIEAFLSRGRDEVLLDDAGRLAANAEAAGVDTTLEVWPEMVHVWHATAGFCPEGTQAIERIAEFTKPKLGLPA